MQADLTFRRQTGLTLYELAIGLAIMGVLAAVAVPSAGSWMERTRMSSHAEQLVSSLQLARSAAIQRNGRVAMCKSGDGQLCSTGGSWEQGHIVFHDANNNIQRDPGEELLHQEAASSDGYLLAGNAPVRSYVSYSWDGMSRTQSGAFQAGTITICRRSPTAAEAWQIIVNSGGRPRRQRANLERCG